MYVMLKSMLSWTRIMHLLLGKLVLTSFLFVNFAHFFLNSGLQFLTVCVHILPLQRLYVTMFPCNECAKIIIQVFKIFSIVIYRSIDYKYYVNASKWSSRCQLSSNAWYGTWSLLKLNLLNCYMQIVLYATFNVYA